jgi:hypothetical protein
MSYYDSDPWGNHQLNEIKCGECEREYDEQEGEGNICPTCKEQEGETMLNAQEKKDVIYALEEWTKVLESEGNINKRNEVMELTWKVSSSLGGDQ